MIVLFGSNHDDILYFESVMTNKKKDTLLKRYQITIGNIFNQEVLLASGISSSILSSALASHIFSNYYVDLVIIVGRCISITPNLKLGDIVISDKITNADVDLIDEHPAFLGQIPSLPQMYDVQLDIISYLELGLTRRSYTSGKKATILCSNDLSRKNLKDMRDNNKDNKDNLVVDSISGGIAVSSYLYGIPFIAIKTIENVLGEKWDVENYLKVLDTYVDMDKAVVSAIGDIGRNDIIIGGTRK